MSTKIKLNLDSLKSRREWKRHKVVDGHNVFRILPPFGEASNGYPYRKWQIIWGLTDPESGRARPFASSLTSEKKCPVDEFVKALSEKAEKIKATMQAAGSSEDEIKDRLGDLNKLISDIKPKTVYIYNAVNKAGEVGLLELKSTAHKKMKIEMGQYVHDYNQDPTSLNSADDDSGLWFDVIRSGQFRDTEYDVKKCQVKTKSPTGKVSFEDDRSPLADSVVENFDNLAYDLSTVYQVKTYDQLAEILEANLPGIIEMVPDADLSDVTPAAPAAKQQPAAPKGTKKVLLNLGGDDEADEGEVGTTNNSKAKVPQNTSKALKQETPPVVGVAADDDFMAEADAILNG